MKLSIITINYNNLEGLRKTIDSIVFQTWRDFEWIVVDGGSTDGSRELIEEYAAKGCFAWWCSEPDKGVYNAMNKGIKHAQGEYLNFMNSGDCFHENTTLEQVFEGKGNGADIIYGNTLLVSETGSIVKKEDNKVTLHSLRHQTICHQSCFLKRNIISEYDENYKYVSDHKFWILGIMNNLVFRHIDQIVADYDVSGMSSVNSSEVYTEKNKMIFECIPSVIIEELDIIDHYNNILSYYPELSNIIYYLKKRRLYRRIIKFALFIVREIHKLLG